MSGPASHRRPDATRPGHSARGVVCAGGSPSGGGATPGAATASAFASGAAPATPRARRGLAWRPMVLPLAASGLILAGVLLAVGGSRDTWTVSRVMREMRQTALDGAARPNDPAAGMLGPVRIAATSVDGATGEFQNFRIESPSLMVAAERATLLVDADADTYAFDLRGVTFTRLPDAEAIAAGAETEAMVHSVDRHVFGPAPFGRDIVPDGEAGPTGSGGGWGPRGAAASPDRSRGSAPATGGGGSIIQDAGAD